MSQYRKKPVVIGAFQLPARDDYDVEPFHAWAEQVGFTNWTSGRDESIEIETLEGTMTAEPLDWIIKGVAGEFYPCKPAIFAATYEPAAAYTEPQPVAELIVRDGDTCTKYLRTLPDGAYVLYASPPPAAQEPANPVGLAARLLEACGGDFTVAHHRLADALHIALEKKEQR